MTVNELFEKLMPTMGPLSDRSARDGALAFLHVQDAIRGKSEIDEATAARLLDELQARFCKPLS